MVRLLAAKKPATKKPAPAAKKPAPKAPKPSKPAKAPSKAPPAKPSGKIPAAKPSGKIPSAKPSGKIPPSKPSGKIPPPKPSSKAVVAKAPPAPISNHNTAPTPGRPIPKMPPAPSRPLSPPRSVSSPPAAPTSIPMPPRPPGPPLLRKITHLESAQTGIKLTLKMGDKAVHPRHGVGEVIAIETRDLGGSKGEFYVLRLLDDATKKIMVPVNAAASNSGLRAIMSPSEADTVLETMRAKEVAVNEHPWSRRFRAYTEMINSGSPYEVAKVMRDMYRLKFDKDLSFGERRLLDQARSLLMKELALAKGILEEELQAEVAKIFELPVAAVPPVAPPAS